MENKVENKVEDKVEDINKKAIRVILTGGGTGGHIYPAVAIGQAIRQEWSGAEILYLGTKQGLENKIVPEAGFPLTLIDVEGWQRKVSLQAVKAGWKALRAFSTAKKIIRGFSPQLVIGTGGYVCLPVIWAASRLRIPTLLHEQNALPGLTNRLLAGRVDKTMLTFAAAQQYFPAKAQDKLQVTGLPVRPAILQVTREAGLRFFGLAPEKLTLVSVGGSRGARTINQAMLAVCRKYAGDPGVQIIHLTGQSGYDEFTAELQAVGINWNNTGNLIIKPYLPEMEFALACADLCVARCGAAFLAEMTVRGIPGILIPYPYAAENHQEHNARDLVDQGAAELILDRDLNGEILLAKVEELLQQKEKRQLMAANSLRAGKPEAMENILKIIRQYCPPCH